MALTRARFAVGMNSLRYAFRGHFASITENIGVSRNSKAGSGSESPPNNRPKKRRAGHLSQDVRPASFTDQGKGVCNCQK
jgi:hypothetical protein